MQEYTQPQQDVREYQLVAPVTAALNRWYQRAQNHNFMYGARPGLHQNGALLFNCGGIRNGPGGNYGWDYVTTAVYNQFRNALPAGFQVAGGPTEYGTGRVDNNGNYEYLQEYYTITRPVHQWRVAAPLQGGIPAGNYNLVLNFHIVNSQKKFRSSHK